MYRKAIAKKKKGAVTGSIVVGLFTVVSIFLALSNPVGWVMFVVCALFCLLMILTVIQNSKNIKKIEQSYPGSLELDVDNCDEQDQVAGKYFFLPTHLVDPFNARMIKYDEIKSVKSTETNNRQVSSNVRHEGRTVTIRTKTQDPNSMPIIFNDFNSGMAQSDGETLINYQKFMELLSSRIGEDVEVTVNQL